VLDRRDLQRVFRNVKRLLNDGGLFQFDMNTVEMLEWVARHEKLFRLGPHFFIGSNEYDRRRRMS
jgi:predicted TPR repeat methyltransferase